MSSAEGGLVVELIILGDSGVGKSALLQRFARDHFESRLGTTIGLDTESVDVEIEGAPVKILIHDTAGQERFRSIVQSQLRKCSGAIIVFDRSQVASFQSLRYWIDQFRRDSRAKSPILALAANKSDIVNARERVNLLEAQELAREYGIPLFETSCQLGPPHGHVREVFLHVASEMIKAGYACEKAVAVKKEVKKESRCCA